MRERFNELPELKTRDLHWATAETIRFFVYSGVMVSCDPAWDTLKLPCGRKIAYQVPQKPIKISMLERDDSDQSIIVREIVRKWIEPVWGKYTNRDNHLVADYLIVGPPELVDQYFTVEAA